MGSPSEDTDDKGESSRKNSLDLKANFDLEKAITKRLGKSKSRDSKYFPSGSDSSNETSLDISGSAADMRISRLSKLSKFSKGENFSKYCERFREYVKIMKIRDRDLYMLFLQNVDDETYTTLKSVKLGRKDKSRAAEFCAKYKKAIYGDEKLSLRHEVMDCRQKSGENVSDYAYRLREKSSIAYSDTEYAEENCMLAFLRGVKNINMKVKLNEASLTNFNDAVKLAKKIEKVEKMLNVETDITSIFKETRIDEKSIPRHSEEKHVRFSSSSSERSNHTSGSRRTSRSPSNVFSSQRGNRDDYSRRSDSSSFRGNFRNQPGRIRRGNPHQFKSCYTCGRRGHIQVNCRENPNNTRPSNNTYRDNYRGAGNNQSRYYQHRGNDRGSNRYSRGQRQSYNHGNRYEFNDNYNNNNRVNGNPAQNNYRNSNTYNPQNITRNSHLN